MYKKILTMLFLLTCICSIFACKASSDNINYYTITFMLEDFAGENYVMTVEEGVEAPIESYPTVDTGSKEVVDWSINKTYYIPLEGAIEEDIVLYPVWKNYKAVNLHRRDEVYVDTVKVYEDKIFNLEAYTLDMQKPHYNGINWYDNVNYLGEPVFSIDYDTALSDYYFQWEAKEYCIHFDYVTAGQEIASVTYLYGETFDLPSLTKVGYDFKGWYDNRNYSGDALTAIDLKNSGNKTLYAKFEKSIYTITLEAVGGMLSESFDTAKYGENYKLEVPVKQGYEFLGWFDSENAGKAYTDQTGEALSFYEHLMGITLYAHWEFKTSDVYVDPYNNSVTAFKGSPGWSGTGNFSFDMTVLNLDLDALIAQGYKCTFTFEATIKCSDTCYMGFKLMDAQSAEISYTTWDNKLLNGGGEYEYSFTVDFSTINFKDKRLNFEFSARADGGSRDWNNNYTVSDFVFSFVFYK